MNFTAILDWVKTNVFIVVFSVIVIAAPIAMWLVAAGMNQAVREEVSKRAQNYPQLVKLENPTIDIPGQAPIKGMINDQFLEGYGKYAETLGKDAELVQKAAVEHNRRHHKAVMEGVLPEVPPTMREILPRKFWEAFVGMDGTGGVYQQLLQEIGASSPPTLESMREDIERVRTQFITQELQKGDLGAPLSEQETKRLEEKLTSVRLNNYAMAADKTGLYLTLNEIESPQHWPWPAQPSMSDLFNWQWQYWIQQDILGALHEANKSDQSVARAPVKRVISLRIFGLTGSPAAPGGSGQQGGSGRLNSSGGARSGEGMDGDSGDGGDEGDGSGAAASPAGAAANPKAPVPLDYSASFTGRKTNPLYDVIVVQLDIVAETARLPAVLDALGRQNYITITGLVMIPADPFEAARDGFFYGGSPVSNVTLQLETIWLREWTNKYMPNEVKQSLSISVPQAAGAAPSPAPEA